MVNLDEIIEKLKELDSSEIRQVLIESGIVVPDTIEELITNQENLVFVNKEIIGAISALHLYTQKNKAIRSDLKIGTFLIKYATTSKAM